MTGNPYIVPAVILIAAVLLACVTALAGRSVRPAGRHSRPAGRAHAAKPFADPQDLADPDGEQYAAQLAEPTGPAEPDYDTSYDHPGWDARDDLDALAVLERSTAADVPDLEWWKQLPAAGDPVVEILTGPAAAIRHTSALTFSVLARVRDSLAALSTAPPLPAAADAPDDPDATRDFPAVTAEPMGMIP